MKKTAHSLGTNAQLGVLCIAGSLLAGCASTSQSPQSAPANANAAAGHFSSKYKANDGRTIVIGPAAASDNGWAFRDPHLEKCWIADEFNFRGYDTLYLAPTLSTAKFQDNEERPHRLAKENLVTELHRSLETKGIFTNVVTSESDIKPGARVLKLENTIIEYSKGGGAARYWAGLYGGGQPVLRIDGKMTDGGKVVFTFQGRRSGVSAGARMTGAFMKDEDIQIEDIRSLVLDLGDFVAAVAGKYQPKD